MTLIDLDDMELAGAAMGARVLALKAKDDRERQQNPSIRDIFDRSIKFHDDLAAKLEQARNHK